MGLRKWAPYIAILLVFAAAPSLSKPVAAVEAATIYVEQVDAVMPEFDVRFQLNTGDLSIVPIAAEDIAATLDGKPLTIKDVEAYTEGTLYLFLVDISGSIQLNQNAAIKQVLTDFRADLRPNDRMAMAAFGESVTVMLNGDESEEDARDIINSLTRRDQTTHFYDAISVAKSIADNKVAGMPDRIVVFCISDGLDDTEGGGHTSREVADLLKQSGLPLWALGLSRGGLSGVERAGLDAFGELARNSGGGYATVTAVTLGAELDAFYNYLQGVQTAKLAGENNIVDFQEHILEFSVEYNGALISSQIPVRPARWIPDDDPPIVIGGPKQDDKAIVVVFSEPLFGADLTDNYKVTNNEGETIPLFRVNYDPVANTVTIAFSGQPYKGEYNLSFLNITDVSMEQNKLTDVLKFQYDGPEPPAPTAQTQTPADTGSSKSPDNGTSNSSGTGDGPAEPPVEKTIFYVVFMDYWWAVLLLGLVVAAVIIWLVIYNTIKKRKGLVKIDGVIGFGDAVEFKHHFETPESKKASLIVTDIAGRAQRIDLDIYGSFFVGRSEQQNNLSFEDEKMSRQHFVIEANGDGFFLSDLNSTNGTNLNGVAINGRRRLQDNDVITAGHEKFVFSSKQ